MTSNDVIDLADFASAREWVRALAPKLNRPCVVRLSGGLGAGKTQIVRWLVELLGDGGASSPSFAIHHEYATPRGIVDHVDLYRLQSAAELEATGFWDLFSRPDALVLVEWADRLPDDVWPESWLNVLIHLENTGAETRRVRLSFKPPR